jgi:hypothetical protein
MCQFSLMHSSKKQAVFPYERSRVGQAAFSGNRVVISGLSFFRSFFQRFSREIAFCLVPIHDFRTDELRNFHPGGIDGRSEKSDGFIQFPDNGDFRFVNPLPVFQFVDQKC